MIVMKDIVKKYNYDELPSETKSNLDELLEKVNKMLNLWATPVIITSGLRTIEDQIRIYAEKGITDQSKIPLHSKHLSGQALDIYDPNLRFTKWLKQNDHILVDCGLWCEEGNKDWVHFQTVPPKSGNRWFLP